MYYVYSINQSVSHSGINLLELHALLHRAIILRQRFQVGAVVVVIVVAEETMSVCVRERERERERSVDT